MVVVQELLNAAYKAGFDRILLADPRNQFFYKKEVLLKLERKAIEDRARMENKSVDQVVEEMQKRMELLYDRTAHDLGMRKVKGYWVLEFP